MSKAVAVEGDTKFMTSAAKHEADTDKAGRWVAGALQVTTGKTISVGGKKVELGAEMSWTYIGGKAGGIPIALIQDKATLNAKPTKLKDKSQNILVDGDEVSGDVDSGNKISVTTSHELLKTN